MNWNIQKAQAGDAAGSLFLTKEWSDWHSSEYWWIQSVYVQPQFRMQGVFSSLYSFVKQAHSLKG